MYIKKEDRKTVRKWFVNHSTDINAEAGLTKRGFDYHDR
jgi:hypothetical protein